MVRPGKAGLVSTVLASAQNLHVATDWTALGIFLVSLAVMLGGLGRWMISRLDRNRADWKSFVAAEVQHATAELVPRIGALERQIAANSDEIKRQGERIITQGEALARIDGALHRNLPG